MPLTSGTRLGRYEIRTQIGAGGMGEVYLAQDLSLRRSVAIKLLPAERTQDEDRLRRFEQEACAASGLNHPNIITIHEIGVEGETHFIATEFIDGESLRQRMTSSDMKLREMLDIVIQVAAALTAAHQAGIVHRDIKPENIMVRRDGYVKVLDFGLAKLVEHQAADSEAATLVNTDPGLVMGTASYMSPEQARGMDVDARTDIWSLGVVIYEMVAGRVPFEGTTTGDILGLILGDRTAPPLARFAREVPSELERIVSKALTKEREERYQRVKDLLLDLKSLKQELEFHSKLGRALPQSVSAGGMIGSGGEDVAGETSKEEAGRPIRSGVYLINEITHHKRSVIVALATFMIALAAIAYFFTSGSESIDSLAVLPFTYVSTDPNLIADPDREYLSDGITESLINSLSQQPGLRLIARSSVFRYKGKEMDPQTVGRELGVRAVLTGRIIQRGDNLTISVELVDLKNNSHVWGEQYNRKVSDTLAVQQEISREISERLRLRLTGEEQRRPTKLYTENAEAYQLYLKGRYFWNKRTPADLDTAARYFQQAIEKDPAYALAYSGLADSHHYMGYAFGRTPPKEAMPKAKAAALKALELDESLAEAHASLGLVKFVYDWDWAGAESEFKRAIELKPNYPSAHHFYSVYLANVLGRFDEAIAEAKRGLELDPLSININNIVALHLFNARRYDEAIEQRRKMLEMDPQSADAHYQLGEAYAAKGLYQKAFDEHMQALVLWGNKEPMEEYRQAYATSGWNGYRLKLAQRSLESLLAEWQKGSLRNIEASVIVESYIQLGEKDKAFEWLGKMFEARDGMLIWLKVNPNYDRLRSDPRFTDLVRRVGLSL